MKAMVLHRVAPIDERPLVYEDVPDPVPAAGEVLVRIHACAVCRTDLHVIEADLPDVPVPIIPGHQAVGTVERCGTGCSILSEGDRVGIAWLRHTCGACEFCLSGRENLCPQSRYTGYHENGGYAELAVVDERFAYRLPDVFSDTEATPLLCAGIIGYRALKRSEVPPGGTLALYGFGSSAHMVIQVARHRGCRVFVATRGDGHRELAARMGAEWVGGSHDLPPEPVDSAIVFAPAGEIVPRALRALQKGGTVALAGIHMSTIPELNYKGCLFHEKNLRSVEANTREDGRNLLSEAARIPMRPEVTTFRLDEANDALIQLKHDGIDGTGVLLIDR